MRGGIVVMNRVSQPEFLKEVQEKGDYMRSRLEKLQEKVSIIGDIRGKGLMMGTEFIDPNSPKDFLGAQTGSGEIAARVQKLCFENKLVMEKGGRNGAVMRCLCALNVTRDEIEQMLSIFEKVVIDVDKEVKEGKFGK
jgi:diaminobutyrate-2-oxoglutarate transaminase